MGSEEDFVDIFPYRAGREGVVTDWQADSLNDGQTESNFALVGSERSGHILLVLRTAEFPKKISLIS